MLVIEDAALAVFLVFCRVGGCILVAPGLSSARIPTQVRILIATSIAVALSPSLASTVLDSLTGQPPDVRLMAIVSECLTGATIGLIGRILVLALQFSATAISNMIGLAGIPGMPLDDAESGSPLATLASSAAVVILLALNLHIEMLRAIMESYSIFPPGQMMSSDALLQYVVDAVTMGWVLALRLAAPFIVYGILVNTAIGLANRFTPQVSFYHATTGVVMLGGFLLFWLLMPEWLMSFVGVYQHWLIAGGF